VAKKEKYDKKRVKLCHHKKEEKKGKKNRTRAKRKGSPVRNEEKECTTSTGERLEKTGHPEKRGGIKSRIRKNVQPEKEKTVKKVLRRDQKQNFQ